MQKGFEVVNLHGTASGMIAVPVIGENGNWWIGNEDTGIKAQGESGPQGEKGEPGPAGDGGDGTPIGTVIAYMGIRAPQHYLDCNGAMFNIADYPQLSQHIREQFGIANYFGGDGISTFAVPDLRNEFLRGYRGTAEQQLSGDVGIHQEPTVNPYITVFKNKTISTGATDLTEAVAPKNMDAISKSDVATAYSLYLNPYTGSDRPTFYTARPTNIAVLYCIKYE